MKQIEILFFNTTKKPFFYQNQIKKTAIAVLEQVMPQINKRIKNVFLSVILLKDSDALKLNKFWRHKNEVPLILSFPMFSKKELQLFQKKDIILGDIFIARNAVSKQAKIVKKSELGLYQELIIHSILHLVGFQHKTDKDYKEMREQEIKLQKQLIKPFN